MKKINVKGPIISNDDKWIYDLFEIEATCPKDVTDILDENPNVDVEVIINSGGGSVYDASEIYTALRSHNAKVKTSIVGLAASAASVIAMAGKPLSMSPTAKMMIHNASMLAVGDFHDMEKASEILRATNKAISNAYQEKSGLSEEELLKLMDEETWFTAQEAKENGLIDEVMFEENKAPVLVASSVESKMIPQEVINKMRNEQNNKAKGSVYFSSKGIVSVSNSEPIEDVFELINKLNERLDALEQNNIKINTKKIEKKLENTFSKFLF